jgi:putative flippase GtrA
MAASNAHRLVRAVPALQHRSHPARQFVRFLIVGLGNTALSFVAYRLLLAVATPYAVAAPLAFGIGATNGYIFNRRWTFVARDSMRARIVYVAVQAAGAAAATLLVVLYVRVAGVDKVLAYLAAIAPVTVSTFVANRLWTFADRNQEQNSETTRMANLQ